MHKPYAWQRFLQAVEHMATGEGSVADRLEGARLSLVTLKDDDFPAGPQQNKFRAIKRALTMQQEQQLSQEDAHVTAKQIFGLFMELCDQE